MIIFPISFLSPVSLWVIFFFLGFTSLYLNRKNLYFLIKKKNHNFLVIGFLAFTSLSLIWTNNFNNGLEKAASIVIIYILFIILKKEFLVLNKERIKKLLTYSYLFTITFFLVDIYFSLGIKPWLGLIFDSFFSGSEKQYVDSYLNFCLQAQK